MDADDELPPQRGPLSEIAAVFLKLGFLAFGGPAAHTAMMQDELVRRRKWLGEKHFLDAVAAVQVVPGPNSTELAIHMGQLRGGFRGLLVAGACFIGPAVLVILPLAIAYVELGRSAATQDALAAVMHSVSAAVIGVILVAGVRLAKSAVTSVFLGVMAVLGLLGAILVPPAWQPEILTLAVAAVLGIAVDWARNTPVAASLALPLAAVDPAEWGRMALFFLKVGGTLFGSGYVLVNYLDSGLAGDLGWLTRQQVLDAVAIGQTTPGPLLTTSTFAGYLIGTQQLGQGIWGSTLAALLATAAMFAPAFLFVALLGPLLGKLRRRAWARAMLAAMGAAAVGLILAAVFHFAGPTLLPGGRVDWLNAVLAVVTVAGMLTLNLNATWLIGLGLAVGAIRAAV